MYEKTAVAADKAVTLNDRLNKTLDALVYQCERIEAVLSRVNGTPQKIETAKSGNNTARPVLSMTNAMEGLESTTQRLIELTNNVERIA